MCGRGGGTGCVFVLFVQEEFGYVRGLCPPPSHRLCQKLLAGLFGRQEVAHGVEDRVDVAHERGLVLLVGSAEGGAGRNDGREDAPLLARELGAKVGSVEGRLVHGLELLEAPLGEAHEEELRR